MPSLFAALKWSYRYSRLPFPVEGLFRLVRRMRKNREYAFATSITVLTTSDSRESTLRRTEVLQLKNNMLQLIVNRSNRYFAQHNIGDRWSVQEGKSIHDRELEKEEEEKRNRELEEKEEEIDNLTERYYEDIDEYGASRIDYAIIEQLIDEKEHMIRAIKEAPKHLVSIGQKDTAITG